MQEQTKRTWRDRRSRALAIIVPLGMAVGACSSSGGMFGSSTPAPSAAAASSETTGSIGSSISNFLIGPPAQPGTAPMAGPPKDPFDCPSVTIRDGAATLSVTAPSAAGQSALGVRYQVNFGQTARECVVLGATVTMKVGVQGRVVLGPAGGPGQIEVPLRYALVQEGPHPKTIWTKLYMAKVTIPSDETNVPFTHVEEDMTIPVPKPKELASYVIYVGFDPSGAATELKKGRGKAKPRRKS